MTRNVGRRQSIGRQGSALHAAVAWVAVLGLYLHLLAAALCVSPTAAVAVASPICHADHGNPTRGNEHGHLPPAPCPFCFAHAHVTSIPAPVAAPPIPAAFARNDVLPRISLPRAPPRRVASTGPRGPPLIA